MSLNILNINRQRKNKTTFHCLYLLGNRKMVKFMYGRKDLGGISFRGKRGLLDFNLTGISTPVGKNCKNNISELWKGWCDSDKNSMAAK